MFGTIRKHQTWLWAVIITLTVISFVVYFSPYSRLNSGALRQGANGRGSINDEPVTDQQYFDARREVDLRNFLNTGHWLGEDRQRTDKQIDQQIYQWMLIIQKEEQYRIHVSDEDAAAVARNIIHSFQRMGITSPQMFVERVLQPHGLQLSDFARFVRHDIGLQQLITTVGLGGQLVTPQDARQLYEREHREVASEAVLFAASNYVGNIIVTPDEVSQFYSNRLATYAIPERVAVNYVKFNVTNFLAEAKTQLSTNLDEQVEMEYDRLGTNGVPGAKTPEEAKTKIREELVRQQALRDAGKKVNAFIQELSGFPTNRAENLGWAAQSNSLPVRLTAPFDREDGPKDLDVGSDFIKDAFALTPDEPITGPLQASDGFYVIAYNKRLPRETPTLASIRQRVVADYKQHQGMLQARQAALGFYETLTNSLAHGRTLADVCTGAKLKPLEVPPFSISSQKVPGFDDLVNLSELKQSAFATPPGKASPPLPASEGFLVLYVKAKLPIDRAQMEADLPRFTASVRRSRQMEAFNDWFRREAEKGLSKAPPFQTPPSMATPGAKS